MIDYFALLQQPQRPWLDPEELKQAFHAATRAAHPDSATGDDGDFALLNEAHRVLRDPKQRLQHLLALRGASLPKQTASIPVQVEALFPRVAAVLRETQRATSKTREASSALTRSIARAEMTNAQRQLAEAREELQRQHDNAIARLKAVAPHDDAELHALYLLFSYLTRWLAELDEQEVQVTLAMT